MKVVAHWQGGFEFNSHGEASGHNVTMDAKEDIGGENKGSRPMEMILHGVAGCMGIDLNVIMRHHMESIQDMNIVIEGTRANGQPERFTDVHIIVNITGDIPEKVATRAVNLSAEKYCSAIASLNANVTTQLELNR